MPPRPKLDPPAALPEFISPELATLVDQAPAGDGWVHEIKRDGYRTAARLGSGKTRMLTRSGLDWTVRFRPITAALAGVKASTAYLDGEMLGEDGVTSFAALQDALSRGQAERLTYHVFDLLHLDGRDLTLLPLIKRKALLAPLLARLPKGSPVRYSDHVEGLGAGLIQPGVQTPPRRHRLEARRGTLSLAPDRGLAEGEMPQPAGVRNRRLDALGQARPGAALAATRLLRGRQADLRGQSRHRLRPRRRL
jgi:hypothetical protein